MTPFWESISGGSGQTIFMAVVFLVLVGLGAWVWKSPKKAWFGEILIPCTFIACSVVMMVISLSFPSEEAGPAAIPRLWAFWTIVLCGGLLWQVFRGKAKPDPKAGRLGFLLLVVCMVIAYYFAMQIIGYMVSSFVFLAALMFIFKYPKKPLIFVVAGGWTAFSYLVFVRLLFIQLPMGIFEDMW